MEARESELRESVVVGHRLKVYPSIDGGWNVSVDGDRVLETFATSYDAWAVGAAESYRQGRITVSPCVQD